MTLYSKTLSLGELAGVEELLGSQGIEKGHFGSICHQERWACSHSSPGASVESKVNLLETAEEYISDTRNSWDEKAQWEAHVMNLNPLHFPHHGLKRHEAQRRD